MPARTVAQSARRKAQALLTQLHDTSLPPSTRAPAHYCLSLLCLRCRFPTITIYHHHHLPPPPPTTNSQHHFVAVDSVARAVLFAHCSPSPHAPSQSFSSSFSVGLHRCPPPPKRRALLLLLSRRRSLAAVSNPAALRLHTRIARGTPASSSVVASYHSSFNSLRPREKNLVLCQSCSLAPRARKPPLTKHLSAIACPSSPLRLPSPFCLLASGLAPRFSCAKRSAAHSTFRRSAAIRLTKLLCTHLVAAHLSSCA